MIDNGPIILGLEGTAHTAGVAVTQNNQIIANKSSTYYPTEGGIHPREAAQFLATNFPLLIEQIYNLGDVLGEIMYQTRSKLIRLKFSILK